jgi:membrane protein YqaA with SNARE-associated domain
MAQDNLVQNGKVPWENRSTRLYVTIQGVLVGLAYFVVLPFTPEMVVLPFILSAPFRVIWYILIARKLFQLGNG